MALRKIQFYGSKSSSYQQSLQGWLANPARLSQGAQLAESINNRRWQDTLFNVEESWIDAKIALETDQISLDDYVSVMLRRAIAIDLDRPVTAIQPVSLDDERLIGYLDRARVAPSYRTTAKDFVAYAKKNLTQDQQYCFVVETNTLNSMFQRILFREIGSYFEPVSLGQNNYLIIIPSFGLLKCWQRYYVETYNAEVTPDRQLSFIEIEPCEGELTAKDILHFHSQRKHPLGLSTPLCEQIYADGHFCGHYAFAWHDGIFHWARLTRRVNFNFDVYVIAKAVAYYESATQTSFDDPLPSYLEPRFTGLRMLLTMLIDMEHSLDMMRGEITRPISDIIRGPLGTYKKNQLMKHYNYEVMIGLLSFVLYNMIIDREQIKEVCGIDVSDLLKLIIVDYAAHTPLFGETTINYYKENGLLDVILSLKGLLSENKLTPEDKNWLRSITSITSFTAWINPRTNKTMSYAELETLEQRLQWLVPARPTSSALFQPASLQVSQPSTAIAKFGYNSDDE